MKRKLRRSLDAFLDGALEKLESGRLREELSRNPEARAVLALEQSICQALAALPQKQIRDLKQGVLKALETGKGAAGHSSPRSALRTEGQELFVRSWWAAPVLWAGAALAAGTLAVTAVTTALRKSEPQPVASVSVQKTGAPKPELLQNHCQILRVSGEVQAKTARGTLPLRAGDTLARGDGLWTEARAAATLEIGSTARLLVHEASEIRIRDLTKESPTLELLAGRVTILQTGAPLSGLRLQARELALEATGSAEEWVALRSAPDRAVFGVRKGTLQLTVNGQPLTLEAGRQIKFWKDRPAGETAPLPEDPDLTLEPSPRELRATGKPLGIAGQTDSHARLWFRQKLVAVDGQGRFELRADAHPGDTLTLEAEDLLGQRTQRTLGPVLPPRTPPAKGPQKDDVKKYKIEW